MTTAGRMAAACRAMRPCRVTLRAIVLAAVTMVASSQASPQDRLEVADAVGAILGYSQSIVARLMLCAETDQADAAAYFEAVITYMLGLDDVLSRVRQIGTAEMVRAGISPNLEAARRELDVVTANSYHVGYGLARMQLAADPARFMRECRALFPLLRAGRRPFAPFSTSHPREMQIIRDWR